MSKETDLLRIIPNEVIVVGKLRDEKDTTKIDTNLSIEEQLKAMYAKFKFVKETAPSAAAKEAGFLSGRYFQIQMGDPGGEMITLPNGNKVRRSRKTTDPGYDNIFESNRATTFQEIYLEMTNKSGNASDPKESRFPDRVEIVAGDPNKGLLRLKEYALMGFWDMFPLGFTYAVHQRDASGKLVPFMSSRKQPDGSFKKEQATANTGRHFVYEDEVHNLEGLRDNMRKQVEQWKLEPKDNTTVEKGVVTVTAPTEATKPADDTL